MRTALRLAITAISGRRARAYYSSLQTQGGDAIITQNGSFILLNRGNIVTENYEQLLTQSGDVIISQNNSEILIRR